MIALIQKRKYNRDKTKLAGLCSTKVAIGLSAPIFTPLIKPKKDYLLINWGVSSIPWLKDHKILNHPENIKNAISKIATLSILKEHGIPTPLFTTSKQEAEGWLNNENKMVFCRTKESSYQGKGIVIANSQSEIVDAPLYTLRVPKKWEYRVHVVNGRVIHLQQKKKLSPEKMAKRGIKDNDGLIRSYNNGYIFSTNISHEYDSQVVKDLMDYSIRSISALGLDFGAVDLLVTANGKVKVLEVNTAPGIDGSTVESYISAFEELCD